MLQVWLRAQHSPLLVWHAQMSDWQTVEGWQQLHDIYHKNSTTQKLCVYFPSNHLLQVDTALNAAQLKQLGETGKQYLFEETALTPIEQLKIRHVNQPHVSHLYAVAQSDIDSWQQAATLAGLSISALLPDYLLLPTPIEGAGQQVVLYQDDFSTLLRQSEQQGLAVSYLPLIFERLPHLGEVCVLPALEESAARDNALAAQTAALLSEQSLLLTLLSTVPTPVQTPERHVLNFFTQSSHSQLSPYLRVAMLVALSALVLQMATDGLQTYRYNQAASATQSAINSQYQAWFPEERLNSRTTIQTQMRPKLRSDNQATAPHMAVLARLSPLIKQSSLHAQTLMMQPNALSFTLIAPNRDSLDSFTSTLNEQGLTANLERVSSDEQGQFSGQITVAVVTDNKVQGADSS